MLPFAVDLRRGSLPGSNHDVARLPLRLGSRGAEINAAEISRHQKLIVLELGHQSASLGLGIPSAPALASRSVGDHRVPVSERQHLRGFPLLFSHGLEFACEIQAGNLALHRPQ